jgi:hypothetical protein
VKPSVGVLNVIPSLAAVCLADSDESGCSKSFSLTLLIETGNNNLASRSKMRA